MIFFFKLICGSILLIKALNLLGILSSTEFKKKLHQNFIIQNSSFNMIFRSKAINIFRKGTRKQKNILQRGYRLSRGGVSVEWCMCATQITLIVRVVYIMYC